MFDDEFIEELPENNWQALKKIKNHFDEWDGNIKTEDEVEHYAGYVEAFVFLISYLEKINFKGQIPELPTSKNKEEQIKFMRFVIYDNDEQLSKEFESSLYNDAKSRFATKFGISFAYEFSEGDLSKVQTSINDLRDLISDSEIIEENHKHRLLKWLERLQSELHKKMSDLDRFWGFVGDAGVVMGKFGNDVKPLTDRIREMMGIVWNTQARAEELESGSPNPFLKENNDD